MGSRKRQAPPSTTAPSNEWDPPKIAPADWSFWRRWNELVAATAPNPSLSFPSLHASNDLYGYDALPNEPHRNSTKKKSPKTNGTSYGHVHVLLIKWQDDDWFDGEMTELADGFKHCYNFHTVKRYEIPSEDCEQALRDYLENWVAKYSKPKTLLMVYYGGHGYRVDNKHLGWALNDKSGRNWSKLQPILEEAKAHVLILLHSCFSAAAMGSFSSSDSVEAGTTELIAACGFETTSLGPSALSFTKALTGTLRELATPHTPFSAFILHQRIHGRLLQAGPNAAGQWPATPVYLRLSGDSKRHMIMLKILKPR